MRKAGFDVVAVENGQLALEEWRADPASFDLAIFDMNMPVCDGARGGAGWQGPACPSRGQRASSFDFVVALLFFGGSPLT